MTLGFERVISTREFYNPLSDPTVLLTISDIASLPLSI